MLSVLTRKDKLPLAYVCCTGAQTDLIFDGASMCFDSKGNLVSLGKTFQEDYFIWDTATSAKPINRVEGSFEEEVLNALIYGVREYSVKMNLPKVILGLSGGIDSAL